MAKHEVVLTIEDGVAERERKVMCATGPAGLVSSVICRRWFGTDEAGKKIKVTVEEVVPTWPVVRWGNSPTSFYCGHCGWSGFPSTGHGECPQCGVTLKGEVPQSKVAEFLREEG